MAGDHYDVLVVGSGPGGATTAARVAETGKRVLLLERGDFLPRERDNWSSRAVFGDPKYTADETFYDSPRPALPAGAALLRGRQLEGVRRGAVPAAARRLRRGPASGRGRAGLAAELRGHGAVLRPRRAPVLGARPARRGPVRRRLEQGLPIPAGAARAAYPAAVRWPGAARPAPVSPAAGRAADPGRARPGHHGLTMHPVRPRGRVPLPARREGRRRMGRDPPGPGRASQSDPDDQDDCRAPADGHRRPRRHRRGGHAPGRLPAYVHRRHRRAVRGGDPVRCPAAEVGQRQASGWPGELLRHGRPELHAAQQPGPHRVLPRTQPDGLPEDAGPQRLLRPRRALGVPDGQHPDARQVR